MGPSTAQDEISKHPSSMQEVLGFFHGIPTTHRCEACSATEYVVKNCASVVS